MFTHNICIPDIPLLKKSLAVYFDRWIDDLMKPYLGVLMTPFGQAKSRFDAAYIFTQTMKPAVP